MTFSIIIPHKNSIVLLKRLLSSIPQRPDLEIIIIDDNSTEEQKEQLKNIQNNQIRLFFNNTEYGFAGKARNIGLKNAQGMWVIFADADDFFTNEFNEILNEYSQSEADIIYFHTTSIYNDTLKTAYRHLAINQILHSSNKENIRYKHTVPWGKMIKRELIEHNKIAFDEIISGNDMMFSIKIGHQAKNIDISDKVLYVTTVNQGSITTTFNKITFESRFQATLRVNQYLRKIKKNGYQMSILFFLAMSYKFGIPYTLHVCKELILNRSNPFIGWRKLFSFKKVIQDRANPQYRKK